MVKKRIKDKHLLLDAGCGEGCSLSFSSDAVEFISIDISRANIIACRQRWTERNYVIADLVALAFKARVFDGVLSADVLEHVDDKNDSIEELARITQEGGFFVGCSTNLLNPILLLDAELPILTKALEMKFVNPGHYKRHSRFTPSSLAKILKSTGYQMDCLYLIGHVLFSYKRSPIVLSLLWMFFDRFTRKKPLLYLKEELVWQATLAYPLHSLSTSS